MSSFILVIIALELLILLYTQIDKEHRPHIFNFKKDLSHFSDEELEAELVKRHHLEMLEKELSDLRQEIDNLKSQKKSEIVEESEEQVEELKKETEIETEEESK
ncbi:MAG: hypothetical protein ACK5LM_06680 [Lactovum sp.]